MFIRACLGLLLLVPIAAWPQRDLNGTEANTDPPDTAPLQTPPPVSGAAYSTDFVSETQANTLRASLAFSAAYSNNVQGTTTPIPSASYSIWPTIAFDTATTRLQWRLNYSPGFTFYQRVSALNQGNQNFVTDFQYRLTPRTTVSLRDSFQKTNNPLNQSNPAAATLVSGSLPAPGISVITPVADQLYNAANAELKYQFSAEGMVGATGTFTNLYYPDPAEARGLFDSNSTGGSVFYSQHLHNRYYVGGSYQYQTISAYRVGTNVGTETQLQTIFGFFTVAIKPTLTLSLSGGPQHSNTTQPLLPASESWSPMFMASLGWQGQRTSLAASYSRAVTGGGGLAGAYHSNNATLSGKWQVSRTWNAQLSAGYSDLKNLSALFSVASPGGHSWSGTISFSRPLGEHLSAQLGYTRIQQSFAGITSTSAIPDANREFVTISYQFVRPLKR